ncbi:hypothetical protein [Actinoallomurus acaciae]|uniref:Uncharacterized protein n=1 Tax=Actinoallomurus acaciae TaxID=502577 RepID=A0ABV5YXE3_9ACTN
MSSDSVSRSARVAGCSVALPLLVTDMAQVQQVVGAPAMIDRAELHRALRAPLPPGLVRTTTRFSAWSPASPEWP